MKSLFFILAVVLVEPILAADNQSFLRLVREGSVQEIVVALSTGVDLEARDSIGRTPLMIAAQFRDQTVVTTLIKRGASVQARDFDFLGFSPLLFCAAYGTDPAIIDTLIHSGADTDLRDSIGRNWLMIAAQENTESMVSAIVKGGVEVDAEDPSGDTALTLASGGCKDSSVVELLVKSGAKVEKEDKIGRTPLIAAIRSNSFDAVRILVRNGAKLTKADPIGKTPLMFASEWSTVEIVGYLLSVSASLKDRDLGGYCPLLYAVRSNGSKVVESLLEAGADVHVVTPKGETVLDLAERNSKLTNTEALKMLKLEFSNRKAAEI